MVTSAAPLRIVITAAAGHTTVLPRKIAHLRVCACPHITEIVCAPAAEAREFAQRPEIFFRATFGLCAGPISVAHVRVKWSKQAGGTAREDDQPQRFGTQLLRGCAPSWHLCMIDPRKASPGFLACAFISLLECSFLNQSLMGLPLLWGV